MLDAAGRCYIAVGSIPFDSSSSFNVIMGFDSDVADEHSRRNLIFGTHNYVNGSNNIVFGNNCNITGNNNIIVGNDFKFIGNDHRLSEPMENSLQPTIEQFKQILGSLGR